MAAFGLRIPGTSGWQDLGKKGRLQICIFGLWSKYLEEELGNFRNFASETNGIKRLTAYPPYFPFWVQETFHLVLRPVNTSSKDDSKPGRYGSARKVAN